MRRIRSAVNTLRENRKKGAALVIAIIIMLLLTMLSLALLTVSYSLHQTAYRQRNMEQCKEIAQGLSKEISAELCSVDENTYQTVQEVKAALEEESVYPLWSYLRCSLWQSEWAYYNENEPRHQFENACRSYELEYQGLDENEKVPGAVTVAIYWESERGVSKDETAVTPVFIMVTCQIGNQKSTITTEYELSIESSHITVPQDTESEDTDWKLYQPQGSCNPRGNYIDLTEAWSFKECLRE